MARIYAEQANSEDAIKAYKAVVRRLAASPAFDL
jgi:hypothetical protein